MLGQQKGQEVVGLLVPFAFNGTSQTTVAKRDEVFLPLFEERIVWGLHDELGRSVLVQCR